MQKLSKAVLGYAAVLTVLVSALGDVQRCYGDMLPHPSGPTRMVTEQAELISYFCTGSMPNPAGGWSIALARIVSTHKSVIGTHRIVGQAVPVETLFGPTQSATLNLGESACLDIYSPEPPLGSDILVVTTSKSVPPLVEYIVVSGPNDPIVKAVRLVCDWRKLPNYADRLANARAIMLNSQESEVRRYSALIAIEYCIETMTPPFNPSMYRDNLSHLQAAQHAELELLAEGNLPTTLQTELFDRDIQISSLSPERGAETDRQIAFLMHVVLRSPIRWKVEKAAAALARGGFLDDFTDPGATVSTVVFPEIGRCLEDRQNADLGHKLSPGYRLGTGVMTSKSAVTAALVEYRDHLKAIPLGRRVDRKLPAPPNDDLMRRLYAAAEK